MAEELNKVEVVIFDEVYLLKGNEPVEYMEMLAIQANKRLRQVQGMNSRLSRLQVSMLATLNVLDELQRLRQEHQKLVDLLEESAGKAKK